MDFEKFEASQPNRIVFNVSGRIFETFKSTLERFPSTLLGCENIERERFYCERTCQYFFNRDINSFEAILYFYQSNGKLRIPDNSSIEHFFHECRFFKLPEETVNILALSEGIHLITDIKKASKKYKHTPASTFIEHVRNFFEYPNSSSIAMIYMLFQSLLIIICIAGYCLDSIPENGYLLHIRNYWIVIEYVASSCFLLDTSLRFALAKDKRTFIKSLMFLIDVLTIPSFGFFTSSSLKNNDKGSIVILKYLRFLRILRILRYSKISRRVSIACVVIKDGAQDLYNFLICMIIAVTLSGSIAYVIEKPGNEASFESIPQSIWWALQTYLTIGYGDIVPKSATGKLFSSIYMSIGILTLMLPVLSMIFKLVKCLDEIKLNGEERAK